jgi:hypothetical protein
LEYLGAKCGEGSGFTRTAIGFTGNQDDCHGNYGSGSAANHVIQTKGQNIDASNSTDRFFFAQKGFTNSNATYTARVDQIENSAASAKAGLMLRLGTASNSRHLSVMVTPSGGIQLIRRATAGGLASITTVSGVKAPIWVRVRRYLDDYYGSYSQDGVNWTPIGQSMYVSNYTGTYNVGLAVTSGTSSVLNTSGFSAVSF